MIIDGATTVKELLEKYPAAFEVLFAHGMCADCQAAPPPVPLHHFAAKHCNGDLNGLLAEIEQTIETKSEQRS